MKLDLGSSEDRRYGEAEQKLRVQPHGILQQDSSERSCECRSAWAAASADLQPFGGLD